MAPGRTLGRLAVHTGSTGVSLGAVWWDLALLASGISLTSSARYRRRLDRTAGSADPAGVGT